MHHGVKFFLAKDGPKNPKHILLGLKQFPLFILSGNFMLHQFVYCNLLYVVALVYSALSVILHETEILNM